MMTEPEVAMAGKYSSRKDAGKSQKGRGRPETEAARALNHEHERIQKWLKTVRFKRSLLGGVNEADVWKKIGELNSLYESALSAERARFDALLAERLAEQGKAGEEPYG